MMEATLPERLSPVHEELEHLHPRWGNLSGMPVALAFGETGDEAKLAKTLGLCDASALPRLTVKGLGAENVLTEQGLRAPTGIFDTTALEGGGLLTRTGSTEFFLEDGPRGNAVASLNQRLAAPTVGVCRVLRQDASFLLSGTEALQVLAETCGVDFRAADTRMIFSRVAGVSCSLLKRELGGTGVFQLWLDGSYGPYLWHTLLEIVQEQRGGPAGLACFFPELFVNPS